MWIEIILEFFTINKEQNAEVLHMNQHLENIGNRLNEQNISNDINNLK